jgi:hypothetical protein
MLKELDLVIALRDLSEVVKAGQIGTIVFEPKYTYPQYEVEFYIVAIDDWELLTVKAEDVREATEDDLRELHK